MAHRACDRLLVSRNRARRQHDDVILPKSDMPVIVDRDARERRLRLALRSGREAQHLLGGVVRYAESRIWMPAGTRRKPRRSRSRRSSRYCGPRTRPCDRTVPQGPRAPACGRCSRRTGRRQLAIGAGEELFEGIDDFDLRSRESLAVDIRAVGEQREYALPAELRKAVKVEVFAVDGGLVDPEVARMDHVPTGVVMARATQSGMLCVTRMNSTVNGPMVIR